MNLTFLLFLSFFFFFFFYERSSKPFITKRYTQAWFRRNDGVPIRYRFETRVSLLIKHGGREEEGKGRGGERRGWLV